MGKRKRISKNKTPDFEIDGVVNISAEDVNGEKPMNHDRIEDHHNGRGSVTNKSSNDSSWDDDSLSEVEDDEERIMRRLSSGNGDLEGY